MAVWEGAVSRGKDAHCVQGTNGTEQTRSTVGTNCGWESCPFSHFLGTRVYRPWLLLSRASQVALVVKNPPANAGDVRDKRLIPGLGRWPRAGHGNPLQYSCLENPMDRRAWQTTVHGVTKSRTWLRRLRTCAPTNTRIQDQTKNTSGFQDGP